MNKYILWIALIVGCAILFLIGLNIGRKNKAKAEQEQFAIVETRDTVVVIDPETMEESIKIVARLDTVWSAQINK